MWNGCFNDICSLSITASKLIVTYKQLPLHHCKPTAKERQYHFVHVSENDRAVAAAIYSIIFYDTDNVKFENHWKCSSKFVFNR